MGKGSRCDGFTLIELVVVLILIGVSVALVAPKISHSLERSQFRKDVRSVSAMLTLARSQAIAHKIPYALSMDLDKHYIWVDTAQQQDAKHTKQITRLLLSHTDRLQVKVKKHEKASGTSTLVFYPNGSSAGGTIQMSHSSQKETVEINLNIVTGIASTTHPSE